MCWQNAVCATRVKVCERRDCTIQIGFSSWEAIRKPLRTKRDRLLSSKKTQRTYGLWKEPRHIQVIQHYNQDRGSTQGAKTAKTAERSFLDGGHGVAKL